MRESRQLATKRDAAKHAKVSVRTIERWIKAGKLTEYRAEVGVSPTSVDLNEIDELTRPRPVAS